MVLLVLFLWIIFIVFIVVSCLHGVCSRSESSETNGATTAAVVGVAVGTLGPVNVVNANTAATPSNNVGNLNNVAAANVAIDIACSSPSDALQPRVYASMSSFIYRQVSMEDEKLECTMCLGKPEDGEKGRLLMKCGHSFHAECIDLWLNENSTCPICRVNYEFTTAQA